MASWFSRVNVYLLVLAVLLSGAASVSAKEADWTKQQAVKEFQAFFDDSDATMEVLSANVAEWTKKVDETGLDLAEESYLLMLGRYVSADKKPNPMEEQNAAIRDLADFITEKNSLPESATTFAAFISGTMPQVASEAITDGDLKRAKKLLSVSTDLAENPDTIYAYIGLQLLETEKPDAHKFLAGFLGETLTSIKLSTRQKHKILTFIYSDRQAKLKQKQAASNAAKFVPFDGIDLDGNKVSVASKAIDAGDLKRAKKLLAVSTDMADDLDSIYAYIGLQLLETEQVDAHKFLTSYLGESLASTKLSTGQKHKILTFIYSDRETKLRLKQAAANAARFVPFKGVDLDGKNVSVADYKGKVLLVDFWASWCGPCISDMPNIVAVYEKYKDKGFEVIGVSLDHPDSRDQVTSTMDRLEMTWPVIYEGKFWQATSAVMNGVQSIPMTYLLDRQGKGRYMSLHGPDLEKAIEELLSEKPAEDNKQANATSVK